MNLTRYTNRVVLLVILILMSIWGTVFYFLVIHEVMDETDDSLVNMRKILVGKALENPEILLSQDSITQQYHFRQIPEEKALHFQECFYDSIVYIQTESEYEPVRVMKSCFRAADKSYYELELRISTLERDDLLETICWALIILFFILIGCTTISTYMVLKKVFRPLQRLLTWLQHLTPGQPAPLLKNETHIREFRILNEAALEMSQRSEKAYEEQKQFIENASHELQTPLAIIRGKLELLTETEGLTEKQYQYIGDMFTALSRVVQLNKSLLLLSRISNGQFPETTDVCLNALLQEISENMQEIYEHKDIEWQYEESGKCQQQMNPALAHILINNMLKNAANHTPPQGQIRISVAPDCICIGNTGHQPLDPEKIFKRFYHESDRIQGASSESTGLGLAIVHSIATLYHIDIRYHYGNKEHLFELKFVKQSDRSANSQFFPISSTTFVVEKNRTDMKKRIYLALLTLPLLMSCTQEKVTRNNTELPAISSALIRQYFSQVPISYIKIEKELFCREYKAVLINGDEIEFDGDGEWKEIECKGGTIPTSFLPPAVGRYLNENFPTIPVMKAERKRNTLEIELQNELEIIFDKEGNFIRLDD